MFQVRGIGRYDDLKAKGGIFRHDGPIYQYQQLNTRAYNDGSLGQDLTDPEIAKHLSRLTLVVGATGLLVAGILFTQVLDRAERR